MSLQFIACSDKSCPMNDAKQCHAPFISVEEDGRCSIRAAGPFEGKVEVESYVDLRRCDCSKCDQWEKDENSGHGVCGFRADLFFNAANICHQFAKQIGEPGFAANV